jgi:hypothetical protein
MVLRARFARLTHTRLQAGLYNWIAFIAPNRFIYGSMKQRRNLCH